MPPFILDIWDKDLTSSDFICRCTFQLKRLLIHEDDEIPEPKWHPCRLKPKAPKSGELFSQFRHVAKIMHTRLHCSIEDETFSLIQGKPSRYNIQGLRDLQSVGMSSSQEAFIIFNLKSLLPPDDGLAIENLRTNQVQQVPIQLSTP